MYGAHDPVSVPTPLELVLSGKQGSLSGPAQRPKTRFGWVTGLVIHSAELLLFGMQAFLPPWLAMPEQQQPMQIQR